MNVFHVEDIAKTNKEIKRTKGFITGEIHFPDNLAIKMGCVHAPFGEDKVDDAYTFYGGMFQKLNRDTDEWIMAGDFNPRSTLNKQYAKK